MSPDPRTRRSMLAMAVGSLLLFAACTAPEPERPAATASPTASPTVTAGTVTATPATAGPATGTPTGTPTPAPAGATGGTAAAGVIVPPSPTGTRYEYACAEGKTFAILAYPAAQERVTLFIEGKTLELKQERQGSGTRHSDGTYTLIAKGVDAFIEQGGVQTYRDCKASRP